MAGGAGGGAANETGTADTPGRRGGPVSEHARLEIAEGTSHTKLMAPPSE